MSDLKKRLPTTLFLILFAFASIKYLDPPYLFSILLFIVISIAAWEFAKLTGSRARALVLMWINGALVGLSFTFHIIEFKWILALNMMLAGVFLLLVIKDSEKVKDFVKDFGMQALAVLYIYFPLYFILELKKKGPGFLFFLIAVIAIGDSGAYFVGRAIGKRRIYPVASPKKTLEGLIAAILTAAISGYLLLWLVPAPPAKWLGAVSAAVIELFSQLSDPVESLFKRATGVKDSGNLLPGHGGVLDRLDSYIFCAPVFTFIVTYFW